MNNKRFVPARAVSMLITIKQNLMADHCLSSRIAGCGGVISANLIDEFIGNALRLETQFQDVNRVYILNRDENAAYRELLCGYTVNDLNDERKKILHELAEKWFHEDEGDEEDA